MKHKMLLLFRNCLQSSRYQCRNRNLPHVSILSVGHIAQIQKLCKAERSHFPNLIQVWRPHPEEGKLSKSQTFDPTKVQLIPVPVSNVRGLSFGWLLHLWSQRKQLNFVTQHYFNMQIMLQLFVKSMTIISKMYPLGKGGSICLLS